MSSCQDRARTTQCRGLVDVVLLDYGKAFDAVPHHRVSQCALIRHYWINTDMKNDLMRIGVQSASVNVSNFLIF